MKEKLTTEVISRLDHVGSVHFTLRQDILCQEINGIGGGPQLWWKKFRRDVGIGFLFFFIRSWEGALTKAEPAMMLISRV